MTALAYTHAFAFLYLVNKAAELSYISRHTPITPETREERSRMASRAAELRQKGGVINYFAARSLEKLCKEYEPSAETTLSKSLSQHLEVWDKSPREYILRELTTFPTFRGWYDMIRS